MDITQDNNITLNESVLDLSKEELLQKYSNLKTQYSTQKELLENKTQELYDCKKQLNVSKALENDLLQEIEQLQSTYKNETNKLIEKISCLEDEFRREKENFKDQINELEYKVHTKEEEIEALKIELENGDGTTNISRQSLGQLERFTKESQDLRAEIELLLQTNNCQTEVLNKSIDRNAYLEEKLAVVATENEELRENLKYQKEELKNINQLLHTCQDENAMLKNELDLFKSNPLDHGVKGNSLFAEVDDRRCQLQQKYGTMKEKFTDMKKQLQKKINEVGNIRSELNHALRQWELDVKEKENADFEWKKQYENQIQEFKNVITTYEKQLTDQTKLPNLPNEDTKKMVRFYVGMIDSKTDEIKKLNQNLFYNSIEKSNLKDTLRDIEQELRKWRATVTHKNAEIDDLKNSIEELKLQNQPKPDDFVKIATENCLRCKERLEETQRAERAVRESVYLNRMSVLRQNYGILNYVDIDKDDKDSTYMESTLNHELEVQNKEIETCKPEGKENIRNTMTEKRRVAFSSDTKTSEPDPGRRIRKSHKAVVQPVIVRLNN